MPPIGYYFMVFVFSMILTAMLSTAVRVFARFGLFAQASMPAWGMSLASVAGMIVGYTMGFVQNPGSILILVMFLGALIGVIVARRNSGWNRYLRSPDAAERQRDLRLLWLLGLLLIALGSMLFSSGFMLLSWGIDPMFVGAAATVVFGALCTVSAISLSWPRPWLWPIMIYFAPLLGVAVIGWIAIKYSSSALFQSEAIAYLAAILAWPLFMFRWRYLFVRNGPREVSSAPD